MLPSRWQAAGTRPCSGLLGVARTGYPTRAGPPTAAWRPRGFDSTRPNEDSWASNQTTWRNVMRSKIIALASAATLAGAAALATCTGAAALRLPDDVYYYSGVTRAFGYTPSHRLHRW